MFIVLLKFSDNKTKAGAFMDGHKAWIQRGFAEGTFLVVGGAAAERRWRHPCPWDEPRGAGGLCRGRPVRRRRRCRGRNSRDRPARTDDRLAFLAA
mgnify:CR=1 FL=1